VTLREERDKFEHHRDAWKAIAEDAKAERDRLREALEDIANGHVSPVFRALVALKSVSRPENERG
jgi:hypothetical protein